MRFHINSKCLGFRWIVGGLLVISALVWGLASPCLTASHAISVQMESGLRWLSSCIVFIGLALFWKGRRLSGQVRACVLVFGTAVILVVVGITWVQSSFIFFWWVTHTRSSPAWVSVSREVASLRWKLLEGDHQNDWFAIEKDDLPDAFDHVGQKQEYAFGQAQMDTSGKPDAQVLIAYGYKNRRWGVYYGNEEYLRQRWPRANFFQPTTNLLYFVTTDY